MSSALHTNTLLQQKLEKAIGHHVKNELDTAKLIYQDILSSQANHFDALHYLGVIHYQQGHLTDALNLIEQAVKLFALHSVCQSNLGNVYQSLGRLEDAIAAYTKAVELNPQFADAYFNLGVVCSALGWPGRALVFYNHCLTLNPRFAAGYNNRGLVLQALSANEGGQIAFELACKDYEQATHLSPNYAQAYFNWGVALYEHKEEALALDKYNLAIHADPLFAMAFNNRGNLLQELGEHAGALESFTKAVQIDPALSEAFYNRGSLYQHLERFSEARADYDQALLKRPNMVQALFNRGFVNEQDKDYEAARADFLNALQLSPEFANAHFNLGLLLLKIQEFDAAWIEYEWRWRSDDFLGKYLESTKPHFDGALPLNTLFIWNEQGVGDDVFFLPWLLTLVDELKLNSSAPKRILCRVDTRLLTLFQRSCTNIEFVDRLMAPSDDGFDAHLPMGSLPLVVNQMIQKRGRAESKSKSSNNPDSSIQLPINTLVQAHLVQAHTKPFLKAEQDRAFQMRSQLVAPGEVLIGISWKSKNPKTGAPRSLDLLELVQALDQPKIRLVNLQYGDVEAELGELSKAGYKGVLTQLPNLNLMQDLDGLSSLIVACDLVVSADNTTVHLSGGLGKKTLVLLPFIADWRWGVRGAQAIWYANTTLFRQQSRGEWRSVIAEVCEEVKKLVTKIL